MKLWKLQRRASALMDRLEDAAESPALYGDAHWRATTAHVAGDVLEMVPMPPSVRAMMNNLLKNWKTTVLGLGAGFGIAVLQSLQGGLGLKDAIIAAGLAAIGLAAKDSTVTGV